MKKIIITLMAIALGFSSYAITADEAYASKNFYVIIDYCRTNKLNTMYFIVYTNKASFVQYKEIYDSCTNAIPYSWKMYSYNFYTKSECDTLAFEYNKNQHNSLYDEMSKRTDKQLSYFVKRIKGNISENKYDSYSKKYDDMIEDMQKSNWMDESAVIAIKCDNGFGNNKFKDILYPRVTNVNVNAWISLAVAYDDVDKIIDALLCADDTITPELASSIISPINAIDVDYRKDEVVKALRNLNARCTIKLYDDQKTWEPILAKIRAMISVRK